MTDPLSLPGHGPVAAFRVGAILATQAIAVYAEPERTGGTNDLSSAFERLPTPLKVRIFEACEEAFRQQREALLRGKQAEND